MSSSDSEDEFTQNFGRVPGEYFPKYWEDNGYGSDPDDSERDSSDSERDSSDSDIHRDCISAGLCPDCLCPLDECQCANDAEEWRA